MVRRICDPRPRSRQPAAWEIDTPAGLQSWLRRRREPRLGPSVLHGEREERTIQSLFRTWFRDQTTTMLRRSYWRVRKSIATQLYAGIGGAVALTMGASIVAWIIFGRIGDTQDQINEGSMSDMAGAFRVAQRVSALADSAPRLALAQSPPEFEAVQAEVHLARTSFEASLAALAESGGESEGIRRVRVWERTMTSNIELIQELVAGRLELSETSATVRDELQAVDAKLAMVFETVLDGQSFGTIADRRELDEPSSPGALNCSGDEVDRCRQIGELKESVAIVGHLLASAFSVSGPAFLEPLREGYEAASSQIERKVAPLSAEEFGSQVVPLLERLATLSVGAGGVFEVRARELEVAQRQGEMLARNREITNRLVSEVEVLVEGFRTSTQFAARTTANTIRTGQRLLLALNLISVAGAVMIAWLFVGRFLIRRLKTLSSRMRYMASGDLEGAVAIRGHDEVADMAAALEVFRRHAFEVQRLNLVEKLAADLQSKNSELESVLNDLRKAQGQIVMREKLAALGELTAGVAHEIKNPLNFVKNFAEVAEELLEELQEILASSSKSMSAEEMEEVQDVCKNLTESLESILQHGDRANRIVHDMLQMGRASSERLCVDINSLVREHAKLAYHSARATDPNFQVHFEQTFDEDLGEIECVPQALGRVVLNIVTNACHATDEKRRAADGSYNPTLWIQTEQVQDRARISIRDNGIGIPDEIREKIFNPFFTTKEAHKGTGLGLALSNDIVREHGGEIRVESAPGDFTEMIVDLPLAQGAH